MDQFYPVHFDKLTVDVQILLLYDYMGRVKNLLVMIKLLTLTLTQVMTEQFNKCSDSPARR